MKNSNFQIKRNLSNRLGVHSGSVTSVRETGTLTCNQHLMNSRKSEGSISSLLVESGMKCRAGKPFLGQRFRWCICANVTVYTVKHVNYTLVHLYVYKRKHLSSDFASCLAVGTEGLWWRNELLGVILVIFTSWNGCELSNDHCNRCQIESDQYQSKKKKSF